MHVRAHSDKRPLRGHWPRDEGRVRPQNYPVTSNCEMPVRARKGSCALRKDVLSHLNGTPCQVKGDRIASGRFGDIFYAEVVSHSPLDETFHLTFRDLGAGTAGPGIQKGFWVQAAQCGCSGIRRWA